MATRPLHLALDLVPAPLRTFVRQLYAAGWRLSGHDGLTVAGYMAFAAFTSLFPFLIFLAALASVLGTLRPQRRPSRACSCSCRPMSPAR